MSSFSLFLLALTITWPPELILPLTGIKGEHNSEIARYIQRVSSVFTSIDVFSDSDRSCRLQQSDDITSEWICPGVGGYKLKIIDSDNRMDASVMDPRGKEHPLNFQDAITRSFSSLGQKADWRVVRKNGALVPIALIIRVNESGFEGRRTASYLSVSKIGGSEICVTDRIAPTVDQYKRALRAADVAINRPCRASE